MARVPSLNWDGNCPRKNRFVRDEDERPKVPYNKFSHDIPVISLRGIDGGSRAEICEKIVKACEDWGIFQVVDHGVDTKLLADMMRLATEFFQLPMEEKLRFDMTGGKKGGFIVSSHLQVNGALFTSDGRILEKNDQTPVTNADFGVQVLISLGICI